MDKLEKELKVIEGYIESKNVALQSALNAVRILLAVESSIIVLVFSFRNSLKESTLIILNLLIIILALMIIINYIRYKHKKEENLKLYKKRENLLKI